MPPNLILSNAAVNAEARALGQLLAGGYLRIYDGPKPANPEKSPGSSRLLAELRFELSVPEPLEGVLVFQKLQPESEAKASGRAKWFRCLQADGQTALLDGSVGTADADLILEQDQINIRAGAEVSIAPLIHGIPKL